MGNGFWAGDAIAQSMQASIAAQQDAIDAKTRLSATQKLVAEKEKVEMFNAANLAEKQALRVALGKIEPNHPLLTNTMLQERIKEAGRRALAMTDNFDAAREAGGSFKY